MTKDLLALIIPEYGEVSPPPGIPSGSGYSIGNLATGFLNVAIIIGIILSLLYLVYGGMFWLQASGDKTKWDKARRIIIYAIVGIIVMSLSLVIVNLIADALGTDVLLETGK